MTPNITNQIGAGKKTLKRVYHIERGGILGQPENYNTKVLRRRVIADVGKIDIISCQ